MNLLSCRGAEDVELWFTEVENLLALEDVGKVCYFEKIIKPIPVLKS